jgi:ribonuclease G
MLEIIVSKEKQNKHIALIENGKLVEIYEDSNEPKETEGNIYIGVVKDILPGMQSAFVDIGTEKNSFIHLKDILPQIDQKKQKGNLNQEQDIRKVVKRNDKILVQVKKDSNAKKGARISTHISIPGRYCILMPNTDIITISQKIENEQERKRLIKIVKSILPSNIGAVIRTASNNKNEEEIEKDIKILLAEWEKIQKESNKCVNEPKLIFKHRSIVEKLIIDMVDKKIDRIICNNKEEYENITKQLEKYAIQNNIKIELREKESIMEMYEIEKQKEKLTARKIWLNCGGFITIDPTEALTAIDVNTGKFMGKSSLEETVYKVNYEATIEIAKQLRLRDIGGIIIIDYIDMHKPENKEKIEKLLKSELKNDRAKTQVEGFTKLDLMELTRKHICSHKG